MRWAATGAGALVGAALAAGPKSARAPQVAATPMRPETVSFLAFMVFSPTVEWILGLTERRGGLSGTGFNRVRPGSGGGILRERAESRV